MLYKGAIEKFFSKKICFKCNLKNHLKAKICRGCYRSRFKLKKTSVKRTK